MVIGIGVDTATIARIEKSIARESFVQRVYGPQEQAHLAALSPAHRAATAAAAWAAKEALGKALGLGLTAFCWTEVQVLHDAHGAPCFAFSGGAQRMMAGRGLKAFLTLTHEGGYATAFVLLEQQG